MMFCCTGNELEIPAILQNRLFWGTCSHGRFTLISFSVFRWFLLLIFLCRCGAVVFRSVACLFADSPVETFMTCRFGDCRIARRGE